MTTPTDVDVVALVTKIVKTDEVAALPDLDLVEAGLLDSLAFVELVVGLEALVGEPIPPTEVDRSELSTLTKIRAFVADYA